MIIGVLIGLGVFFLLILVTSLEEWDNHCAQTNVTLTFTRFKTLYNADPENWTLYTGLSINPIYITEDKKYVVRFASNKDYEQFKKWLKRVEKEGIAPGQMTTSLELTNAIAKVANDRAEKAKDELTKNYQEVVQQMENSANLSSNGNIVLRTGDIEVEVGPK